MKYVKTDGTRITHLKNAQPVTKSTEEYQEAFDRKTLVLDKKGKPTFKNGSPVMKVTETIQRTKTRQVTTPIDGWTEAPDEVEIDYTVNEDGTFSAP